MLPRRQTLRLLAFVACVGVVAATVYEDRTWYVNGAMDSTDPQGNLVATWKCFTVADSAAIPIASIIAGKTTSYASVNVSVTAGNPFVGKAHVTRVPGISLSLPPSFNFTLTTPYLGNTVYVFEKHAYDLTRAREHLALDLLLSTPNIVGFVKKFVRLNIDNTDYGLYTYTESPNAAWLNHHGLAKGVIYQAMNYAFTNATGLLPASAKGYNATAFAGLLAPQTQVKDSHASIIALTAAVGNSSLSTVDLVAQFFDENNLITFLAVEALLGNQDCVSHNYILYQAYTGGAWFIFPYNFETSMRYYSTDLQAVFARVTPRWFDGFGIYYGNALFARLLSSPYYLGRILATAAQLQTAAFNSANVQSILAAYTSNEFSQIFTSPDQYTLPQAYPFTKNDTSSQGARTEWQAAVAALADTITTNYNNIVASAHNPAPGWTSVTKTRSNSVYTFTWNTLQQTYGCVVATDLVFYYDAALTQVAYTIAGLQGITVDVAASIFKPATAYFYRFVNRATNAPTTAYTEAFAPDFTTSDPTHPTYTLRYRAVNVLNTSSTAVNASATYKTTPAAAITNTVTINGVQYATLDNTAPATATIGCQSGYLQVPAGWMIAPNTPVTRAALKQNNQMFGARCLVLADGVSVASNTGGSCVTGDPTVNSYLYDGGATVGVGVQWCPMRVLLIAASSANPATPAACRNDGVINLYSKVGAAPANPLYGYNVFNDTRPGATAPLNLTGVIPNTNLPLGIHITGGQGVTTGATGGRGGTFYTKTIGGQTYSDYQPMPAVPDMSNFTTGVTIVSATAALLAQDYSNTAAAFTVDSDLTTTGTDATRTITARDIIISGALRCGSTGTATQALTLVASDTVHITGRLDCSGADGAAAASGGVITITAPTLVVEGSVYSLGGTGTLTGGAGGNLIIRSTKLVHFGPASTISVAGGDCVSGSTAIAGAGGNVRVVCNSAVQATGTMITRGGYAYARFYDAIGGAGGNFSCDADGLCNTLGVFDGRGGNAGAAFTGGSVVAGAGGAINYGMSAGPASGLFQTPVDLSGGYGHGLGGVGGYAYIRPRNTDVLLYGLITSNGGNSSTQGGAGGIITSFPGSSDSISQYASFRINGTILLDGGSIIEGGAGNGGLGGYVKISMQSQFGGTYLNTTGVIQMNGGLARGAYTGGAGGMMYMYCLDGTARLYGHLTANGGNALGDGSIGGYGGFLYVFTDNNHGPALSSSVVNWGILYVYPGCVLEASGGNGTLQGGDARNNRGAGVRSWPSVQDNQDLVEDTAILLNNDGRHGASTGYTINAGILIANGGYPNGWGGDIQYHGNGAPSAAVSGFALQGPMEQLGNGSGKNGDWAGL